MLGKVGGNMRIMVQNSESGRKYAPLYVHSFRLVQPHFLAEAEKFNLSYSDLSEIDTVADKLRWCRYRRGLLQRDVADYAGVDRGTYVSYEDAGRDLYPPDKMTKIAELFEVPIENLLDEYNLFLYCGQGRQIKALRKFKGLNQREYATQLGIPITRLKGWEQNKAQMFKSTWEKLFRDEIGQMPSTT